MSLKKIENLLSEKIGTYTLSVSAYDTAWAARVRNKDGELTFPKSLEWIQNNQLEDGSWGISTVEYYHDRIISTLAAVVALQELKSASNSQIELGVHYLNTNMPKLAQDEQVTIAFEMLFPSLLTQAKALGLEINYQDPIVNTYQAMRAKKLGLIPLASLYQQKSSLSYSLEFLAGEEGVDYSKLHIHQESDGSCGSSPAATAFLLKYQPENQTAKNYLQKIYDQYDGAFVSFYPIDIFERTWSLSYLIDLELLNDVIETAQPHIDYIKGSWMNSGVSCSRYFSGINLDDTAVAFRVLHHLGFNPSIDAFKRFEHGDTYIGFKGESHPGVSHIANLAAAVAELGDQHPLTQKVFNITRKTLSSPKSDKWNISPYYATSRLPISFLKQNLELAKNYAQHLITTQNPDGSWGATGNLQDTNYALLLAFKLQKVGIKNLNEVRATGIQALNNQKLKVIPNWIAKSLYYPINIEILLKNIHLEVSR